MAPSDNKQNFDDIQFGRLLQQVDTLVDNVSEHTSKFENVNQRVTVLETRALIPVVTQEEMTDLRTRLVTLENKKLPDNASKDELNKMESRMVAVETKRATSMEIWAVVISIISALAAVGAIYFK
jgi:hypothetical protein